MGADTLYCAAWTQNLAKHLSNKQKFLLIMSYSLEDTHKTQAQTLPLLPVMPAFLMSHHMNNPKT